MPLLMLTEWSILEVVLKMGKMAQLAQWGNHIGSEHPYYSRFYTA